MTTTEEIGNSSAFPFTITDEPTGVRFNLMEDVDGSPLASAFGPVRSYQTENAPFLFVLVGSTADGMLSIDQIREQATMLFPDATDPERDRIGEYRAFRFHVPVDDAQGTFLALEVGDDVVIFSMAVAPDRILIADTLLDLMGAEVVAG